MVKLLSEINNQDYYLNYSYDTQYNCDNYGCELACRCGIIENIQIKSVDIMGLIDNIGDGKLFDSYCADRILRRFEIWNVNLWALDIQNSYYGQEIFGAKHDNEALIDEHLLECLTLPESEKIPYTLELEYGYLLNEAKNRTWTIETVQRDDIQIGTEYHKVKPMKEYNSKNYSLPVCVVLKINGKLRIIDGYHRISSNKDQEISVIVGK